ncbi:MAG: hypothetical protein K2L94_00730, partial [Alphaproteobacteria bacterium]|nr:hypothetical protein [Alphaproteobacteria bacterium]
MKKQNNNKKLPRDGASVFLIFAGLLFLALMLRPMAGGRMSNGFTGVTGPQTAPVELSFSDVLRREKDIKTMDIRGTRATGTLRDGTKYRATITYDPELLGKLSAAGATISINDDKTWVDYLGIWVPILMGGLFIWWLLRGMRGGPGGLSRSLVNQNPTKITTGKTKTTFQD